jgi:flagellar biosynthesis protein FliR
MSEALSDLLALGTASATAVFLVFLRIGAAMALLPAFGEQTVPVRVKLALTLCFTAVVAPAVLPTAGAWDDGGRLIAAAGAELAVGLSFGIALRLMVHALQMAGTIAANVTSLSQLFGGVGADSAPAMAQVLVVAGLALAASAGLHVKVAMAFIETYRLFPLGQLPAFGELAGWGTSRIAEAFGLAFVLAAPFTVAALIANLALGAINRAMPQLMVAFVGAPATVWASLALLAVTAPVILAVWAAALDRVLAIPFGARDRGRRPGETVRGHAAKARSGPREGRHPPIARSHGGGDLLRPSRLRLHRRRGRDRRRGRHARGTSGNATSSPHGLARSHCACRSKSRSGSSLPGRLRRGRDLLPARLGLRAGQGQAAKSVAHLASRERKAEVRA